MSAPPRQQHLANPGLPGFARFGGERLARSPTLTGTVPVWPRRDSGAGNFPAGKFPDSERCASGLQATAEYSARRCTCKTFLQESFYTGRASEFLGAPEPACRGGRVMRTTQ
jgi:hypothetical protein